jgi:DNA-directed RNA polymerase specialized sigma24 family protein
MFITDDVLLRVRAGTLDFNVFATRARPEFTALASKMLSPYRGLYTMDVEDLVQEMLIVAHHRIGTWQASYGYPIKRFVIWHACAWARRLCKRQLAVMQVIVLAATPEGIPEETVAPLQELEVEVVETLRDLPVNRRQVAVMNSVFETQCVDRTLAELMADPATRRMFPGDRESVRRGLYRTVTRLTKRAQLIAR